MYVQKSIKEPQMFSQKEKGKCKWFHLQVLSKKQYKRTKKIDERNVRFNDINERDVKDVNKKVDEIKKYELVKTK